MPQAPRLCPPRQSESGCLDLRCYPHKQDLTLHMVQTKTGQRWAFMWLNKCTEISLESLMCMCVSVCVCVCVCVLHLSLSPRGSSWRGHLSSVVQLPSSPPLNNTNIYEPGALIVPEIKKNMQGSPGQFANASSMLLFPEWFPNRRPVFMSHSLAAGFSFSFFFFLHFQGLKMRPRLASLLLRRTGGVRTPETRQPECSTLCWSITSRTQSKQSWSLK